MFNRTEDCTCKFSALSVDQISVFLVLDDGEPSLTYHLLRGFEGGCFMVSAFALDCRRVVEQTSSRTLDFLIYRYVREGRSAFRCRVVSTYAFCCSMLFHGLPYDGFQFFWRCFVWVVEVNFMVLTAQSVSAALDESVYFCYVWSFCRVWSNMQYLSGWSFMEASKPKIKNYCKQSAIT